MKRPPGIWLIVAIYIAAIYLSLPMMRTVLNFLYSTIGREALSILVNMILGIAIGLAIILAAKKDLARALLTALPLAAAAMLIYTMSIPEERIHFLEYGVLGVMVMKGMRDGRWKIFLTITFVISVGVIDELIQFLLPNRVGDIRDVAMNTLGGMLGIWTGRSSQ